MRYFQADQKYVTVRWPDGELLIDDTLRQLEGEFGERFIRIHRNAIVAVKFLEGLKRDAQGHYQVSTARHRRPETRRLAPSRRRPAAVHPVALSTFTQAGVVPGRHGPTVGVPMAARLIRIATRSSNLALWQAP